MSSIEADIYLRKSASICGSFLGFSRPFAVLAYAFAD
jgi:hypothetical protein